MATSAEPNQPPPIPPTEPIQPRESKEPSQPKESKESKESSEAKFEESSKNLPAPHSPHHSTLRQVAPPLSDIPLNRFIYILLTLIALFYIFRLVQYKTNVGGWWNLFFGKTPAQSQFSFGTFPKLVDDGKVETRLHLLAESLGMPPPAPDELVGAIASAVREFVPPASLSSIAAKETGRAVRILVARAGESGSKASLVASSEGAANGVDGVVNAFVGVDDVPFDIEIND